MCPIKNFADALGILHVTSCNLDKPEFLKLTRETCFAAWESLKLAFFKEGYVFLEFFPVFLGIVSRFLVEGRCEEGRKEGMGEGSKKQIGIKKTNKDQKNK